MYDVRETLPAGSLEPGTSVLCRGPPLSGKRRLGVRMLAEGLADGEGAVAVTAQQSGAELRAELADVRESLDTSRLAVVDCVAGQTDTEDDGHDLSESVSSPADLTGVGIALTDVLQLLADRGVDRIRLVLDSLSTLLMYADFERVYRFCHVLVQRVESIGGLGFVTVDAEAVPETEAESLRGLFDAVVELDLTDEERVYRLQREGGRTDWKPVPDETPTRPAEPAADSATAPGEAVTSLHELVEQMAGTASTLTVFEPATRGAVEDVRPFFERHNVAVETASSSDGGPVDFAALHRDGDFHAAAAMPVLRNAVVLDGIETAPVANAADTELVRRLDTDVFSAREASIREMVRISRSIERTAWRAGSGVLHAGFQRLSRVVDEWQTHEVYDAIADRGVDVHLYGVPDHDDPFADHFTVHGDDGDEIADSWFVLFAAGPGQRRGLVCEERGDRRYTGFWTFDADVVEPAIDYLERTY
jgi:KaiC/GvpD/RAD55 family RecA-like ATPase